MEAWCTKKHLSPRPLSSCHRMAPDFLTASPELARNPVLAHETLPSKTSMVLDAWKGLTGFLVDSCNSVSISPFQILLYPPISTLISSEHNPPPEGHPHTHIHSPTQAHVL